MTSIHRQRGIILVLTLLIVSIMTWLTIIMLERTMLSSILVQKRDEHEVKK